MGVLFIMRKIKNNKGFTLIELLAVIVILGIILAIAIPVVNGFIERGRQAAFVSDVRTFETSIQLSALSRREEAPNRNPINPGRMTDEQWNEYTREFLEEFIDGEWPTTTPWGGYYAFRAYPANWESLRRWRSIDDSNRPISDLVGTEEFEMVMIRFVNPRDEEGFNRAVEALKDSPFSRKVYRFGDEFNIGIPVVYQTQDN